MNLLDVMQNRHSVRSYTDKKIEGEVLAQLHQIVEECNRDSGLNIQLCLNEPKAFDGMMARYGKFKNVKNYIALVGKKSNDFHEKCGYYGEKIVLKAQQLGLNTCWVAMTYRKGKSAAVAEKGEKLLMVIPVGYGETTGVPHKSKPIEDLCRIDGDMPDWFRRGMEAARLAPTAQNQQKFSIELSGNKVKAKALSGFYNQVDLGIVKYHFEIGAGKADWTWA
jgi:Putative TM nitroreductase